MKKNNFEKLIYPNKLEEIKYLEANKNNTILHLTNGKPITSGYNLKQFEKILEEINQFARVHRSYIVNMEHVAEINDDSLFLKLTSEEVIPVNFPEVFAHHQQTVS